MISNTTPCCRQCSNPNETFYVQVTNDYAYYIYMSIEYRTDSRLIKKQSPIFAPGKSQRLTFPSSTLYVYLTVFDASKSPPKVICFQYIKNYMSICYDVSGYSVSTAGCLEVPC